MDQDDARSAGGPPRAGNVTATASAGDGRASAHVRVQIVLHGADHAGKPHRVAGILPDAAATPAPPTGRPQPTRIPRRVAVVGLVVSGAFLLATAFAAGALIF